MRKIFIILSVIVVLSHIFVARNKWFSEFEKNIEIAKNRFYSEQIDLSRSHKYTWKIESDDWSYTGRSASVSLLLEKTEDMEGSNYWKRDFGLQVKIDAYAITENGEIFSRLVLNHFFPTDEPLAGKSKLWKGYSDSKAQRGLGIINRFPKEDLYIELTILSPDLLLSKANPQIMIVGNYGDYGFITAMWFIRDLWIFLCILSIVFLTIQVWKSNSNNKSKAANS